MTTCKVRGLNQDSSVFLYQEQSLTKSLQRPYRQRFLQITPTVDRQMVESKSFKPKNPQAWIGLCNKSSSDRVWGTVNKPYQFRWHEKP